MDLITGLVSRSGNYQPVQRRMQAIFPVREFSVQQHSSKEKFTVREILEKVNAC
jgi:hypothetical protein